VAPAGTVQQGRATSHLLVRLYSGCPAPSACRHEQPASSAWRDPHSAVNTAAELAGATHCKRVCICNPSIHSNPSLSTIVDEQPYKSHSFHHAYRCGGRCCWPLVECPPWRCSVTNAAVSFPSAVSPRPTSCSPVTGSTLRSEPRVPVSAAVAPAAALGLSVACPLSFPAAGAPPSTSGCAVPGSTAPLLGGPWLLLLLLPVAPALLLLAATLMLTDSRWLRSSMAVSSCCAATAACCFARCSCAMLRSRWYLDRLSAPSTSPSR
jgi:hypothetical protein